MKISKIFLAVVALFAVACTNNNSDGNEGGVTDTTKWIEEGSVIGDWKLTHWANKEESALQVYLSLNEDGSFDLYQRIYSVVWLHYEGTFTLENNTLSGVYSDGKPWKKSYSVSYAEETPTRIRLIDQSDSADISIYTEGAIPSEIIDEAQPAVNVRSVALDRFL